MEEPAVIIQTLFAELTSTVRTWIAYLGGHFMPLPSVVNQVSFGLSHKGAVWQSAGVEQACSWGKG